MYDSVNELIDEFGIGLTSAEYNQYIPKLKDYLTKYIIKNKDKGITIDNLFKYEFTRSDIINATLFYVEENQNVQSLSAVDDFLISLNRFFDELLFNKFPNPTLMKFKPFSSLSEEINKILIRKGIQLKPRETRPSISVDQYEYILDYIKFQLSSSLKSKQVSILIKLMLLYGLSYNKLSSILLDDYKIVERTLSIQCNRNIKIHIELPHPLAIEIEEYRVKRLEKEGLNSQWLFVTRENNKINNSYTDDTLKAIEESFISENNYTPNKSYFTPTGLQKYAIIQMILQGMNQSIIMDFTGLKSDVFDDCQNEVNSMKLLDRNRYVNYKIRGISTFDDL